MSAAGRLAVPGADAAPDASPLAMLGDSAMDVVEIHDSDTPRSDFNLLLGPQLLQGVDRGLDQQDRVVGAEALGEDIADAGSFADGSHRGAGDHAGTRAGRHQQHASRPVAALDDVRNRTAFDRRRATMLRVACLTAFSTLGGTSLALP